MAARFNFSCPASSPRGRGHDSAPLPLYRGRGALTPQPKTSLEPYLATIMPV